MWVIFWSFQITSAGADQSTHQSYTRAPVSQVTLTRQALNEELKVSVDGRPLRASSFELKDQRIVFNKPVRANLIKVEYKENSPLSNSFKLDSAVAERSLSVFVNDQKLEPNAYRFENGVVWFNEAPEEAAIVRFDFRQKIAPKLNYYSP